MPIQLADDVWLSVTGNPGTSTATLGSRVTGYFDTSNLVDGTQYYYTLLDVDANGKPNGGTEIGYGTYTASGTTFSRDFVYTSITTGGTVSTFLGTASAAKINFSSGTQRLMLSAPAEALVTGSGVLGSELDPSTLSPVVNLSPDTISGNDGDSISTVASGGTADAFVQATGGDQPVLKKGANGLNGHNVIEFNGSEWLSTTTGGASLLSTWTVIEVRKHTSLTGYQNGMSWGDAGSNGKRRSPNFKFNGSNDFDYIGENNDLTTSTALSNATWYVLMTTCDGTSVHLYLNGTSIASGVPAPNTITSYSATAINLGVNPAHSEGFVGDHAYLILVPTVLTAAQQRGVNLWLLNRFPSLSITAPTDQPIAMFTSPHVLANSCIFQDTSGNVYIGGTATLTTTDTGLDINNTAQLSVNGIFAALCGQAEHQIANAFDNQNTLAIWNQSTSGGFSSLRFRNTGAIGEERSAMGFGKDHEPWGAATQGSFYIETSDFTAGGTSNWTAFRLIQTQGGGTTVSIRFEVKANGDFVFNDRASYLSQTTYLTIAVNGDVRLQAGLSTSAAGGFLALPTCAGTPTGTPTVDRDGLLIVDSTNHLVYCRLNGSWVNIA